jgi:hypothetical protein
VSARERPPSQRQRAINTAVSAGYHNDMRAYVRTIVESRVSRKVLDQAFDRGQALAKQGGHCTCFICKSEVH